MCHALNAYAAANRELQYHKTELAALDQTLEEIQAARIETLEALSLAQDDLIKARDSYKESVRICQS